MELSTVADNAEKAKGKRSGFHLKGLALGWWIDMQKQMLKDLNAKLKRRSRAGCEAVSETLGESTVSIREYARGENREMRGQIRREEKFVNMWGEGKMEPLKEERKKPCVFFCSSHSDGLAMSPPKMFLKYGGKLLERTPARKGQTKKIDWLDCTSKCSRI